MTRAKFVCATKNGDNVTLTAVSSGSEENKQFFKATPGGSISLTVVNAPALATFTQGKEYFVDFTQAE